jgi:hypothetical protein
MKIFISYSTADLALVRDIANYIKPHAEVYYWAETKVPGQADWPTIFRWIEQSDLVLVVITERTLSRAMSVGQEIGYAKDKGKIVIPLITPYVNDGELGCLRGIIYQRIQPDNPWPALQLIEKVILAKKQELETKQALFVIGGIFLLILALSSEG